MTDRRTLDELDPPAWGPSGYDSGPVRRAHELREKPIDDFTVDDLRVMIGQRIALTHLVPRAVAVLEADPLAEGGCPGDLLRTVLGVDVRYWQDHQDDWLRVWHVVDELLSTVDGLRQSIEGFRRLTQF